MELKGTGVHWMFQQFTVEDIVHHGNVLMKESPALLARHPRQGELEIEEELMEDGIVYAFFVGGSLAMVIQLSPNCQPPDYDYEIAYSTDCKAFLQALFLLLKAEDRKRKIFMLNQNPINDAS